MNIVLGRVLEDLDPGSGEQVISGLHLEEVVVLLTPHLDERSTEQQGDPTLTDLAFVDPNCFKFDYDISFYCLDYKMIQISNLRLFLVDIIWAELS